MKITNNIPQINDQPKVNKKDAEKRVKLDGNFDQVMKTKINDEAKRVDTQVAQKTSVKEPVGNVPQNTINVAKQASHMKEVVSVIKNTPDIRQQKVDEIKAKIANGTYNVSSEELADKLISSGLIDSIMRTL